MNLPTGNSTSIPFRLCCAGAAHREHAAVVLAPRRDRDRAPSREEVARHRALRPHHLLRSALGDDLAAVLARRLAPCRRPSRRRASSARRARRRERCCRAPFSRLQRRDQAVVVALVEADRRLVEDVEDADELRADLRREPEPLRLAARERLRGPVELEVADADVGEEREPLADLLHDPMADQLLGRRQPELVEEPRARRATESRVNSWIERPPTVTASTAGLRRAPWHSGQGRKLMYSSIRSRCWLESVSR